MRIPTALAALLACLALGAAACADDARTSSGSSKSTPSSQPTGYPESLEVGTVSFDDAEPETIQSCSDTSDDSSVSYQLSLMAETIITIGVDTDSSTVDSASFNQFVGDESPSDPVAADEVTGDQRAGEVSGTATFANGEGEGESKVAFKFDSTTCEVYTEPVALEPPPPGVPDPLALELDTVQFSESAPEEPSCFVATTEGARVTYQLSLPFETTIYVTTNAETLTVNEVSVLGEVDEDFADTLSGEVAEGVVQGWAQLKADSVAFRFNTASCATD